MVRRWQFFKATGTPPASIELTVEYTTDYSYSIAALYPSHSGWATGLFTPTGISGVGGITPLNLQISCVSGDTVGGVITLGLRAFTVGWPFGPLYGAPAPAATLISTMTVTLVPGVPVSIPVPATGTAWYWER